MAKSKRVSVLMSEATRGRLRAEAVLIAAQMEEGRREDQRQLERINPRAAELSMEWVINHLLDLVEDHRRRAREATYRRRDRGGAGKRPKKMPLPDAPA